MSNARNKRTFRVTALRSAAYAVLALTVAVLGAATEEAEVRTRARRAHDESNPLVRRGTFPPDFELPRLTLTTDVDGKSVGVISETDTVKLSSFRGKRPVCLIMSSYT